MLKLIIFIWVERDHKINSKTLLKSIIVIILKFELEIIKYSKTNFTSHLNN